MLAGFASLAVGRSDFERAAHLFGAVAALNADLGPVLDEPLQLEHDQDLAVVRGEMGERTFDAALAEGRAMKLDAAVAFALEGSERLDDPPPS